jgi:hypothetical protein
VPQINMSHSPAPYGPTFTPLTGPDFGAGATALAVPKPYALLHKEPEAQWDENCLQQEAFHWMREHHPEEELSMYAIPNGGLRTKSTAQTLKNTGTKAGYPDVGLDLARKGYHGLRIELKIIGGTYEHQSKQYKQRPGTVKPEQKEWHARLTENGYLVVVAWGLQQFIDAVTEYLA